MESLKFAQSIVLAARPKTLIAAFAPIMLGCSLSYRFLSQASAINESFWFLTFEILLCGILIQILCNFTNDLCDYYRGSDTPARIGPVRAVQSGLISPAAMQKIIYGLTLLIVLFGLDLSLRGGWIILFIGIASIFAAFIYTAGPYPLAHNGLGEVFVLIFFGPVPVFGTFLLLTDSVIFYPLLYGISLGLISAAVLLVNNTRDIEEDTSSNKRTLTVRFGRDLSTRIFSLFLTSAFVIAVTLEITFSDSLFALFLLSLIPVSYSLIKRMRIAKEGNEFNSLLASVASFLFLFSLTLSTLILL